MKFKVYAYKSNRMPLSGEQALENPNMASEHQLSIVFATVLVLSVLFYLHSLNMDSPHPVYMVAL